MERWSGRFALVTGASSGIGAAISKELVKKGMNVIGCSRNMEKLNALVKDEEVVNAPGDLHIMHCDLTQEAEILEVFKAVRNMSIKIDVCINNAGVGHISPLLTGETAEWKEMFEVNIMGLCIFTREAVKLMKETRILEGQIINMGSIGARVYPDSHYLAGLNFFHGAKFMVRLVTEGLRQEIRATDSHIRVASINAGSVETEFFNKIVGPEDAKVLHAVIGSLQTEDIVEAVIYILSTPPHVDVSDIVVNAVKPKLKQYLCHHCGHINHL